MASDPLAAQAALWRGLTRRQMLELTVPGAGIGLLGGVIAGVVALAVGTTPGTAVVAFLSLGIPLGIGGVLYDLLVTSGRLPIGPLAAVALFWVVGFPIARIINAVVVSLVAGDAVAVPHGWLDYLAYNMLLSPGFAIGFWWLHQNYGPRWWFHIRHSNPLAAFVIGEQLQFVGWQNEQRIAKREARKSRRSAKRRRTGGPPAGAAPSGGRDGSPA